jgi:hypothetical protein
MNEIVNSLFNLKFSDSGEGKKMMNENMRSALCYEELVSFGTGEKNKKNSNHKLPFFF